MSAEKSDDKILIWIIRENLSDGSEVFAVELPDGRTRIPAISEDDACSMAETIVEAINDHSNEIAGVMYAE